MISVEVMVLGEGQQIDLPMSSLGIEVDDSKTSDRFPSLWQESILDQNDGLLVHIFDRKFCETNGVRWLYDDVVDTEWKRFTFLDKLNDDFLFLIQQCLIASQLHNVWILTDAQFGPRPKQFSRMSFHRFASYYRKYGLRINSAVPVYIDRTDDHIGR